ncbi:MAG: hypothetical protein ACYDCC_15290 [Actinomycetota bacterium]
MRVRRLFVGAFVAAIAFAPAASMAKTFPPTGDQPSHYCDATALPDEQGFKVLIDINHPAVCFDPFGNGYLKGAIWADTKHHTIVFDGDAENANSSGTCSSGYVGVSLGDSGTDPHLVWSPTNNFNPASPEGQPGSPNHRFDPKSDPNNIASCTGQG